MLIEHFEEVDSTNDIALDFLKKEDRVIITADFQKKGRGRKNREWIGDKDSNMFLSYGFKHFEQPKANRLPLYQAIGCLSVKYSLEKITKQKIFGLKYPNDVYAGPSGFLKKICGVLVEHTFMGNNLKYTIIGIGVNINQTSFPEDVKHNATSLSLLDLNVQFQKLKKEMILQLIELEKKSDTELFKLWADELNIIGKEITFLGEDTIWNVKDFLYDGRLLAENSKNETKIIDNGDSIRYKIS